ncbi:hypothetical protein [Candidatus Harpocratesius sp.]
MLKKYHLDRRQLFSILIGFIISASILFPLALNTLSPFQETSNLRENRIADNYIPNSAADVSPWWNEIYEYRIKITVSTGGVSQTDYPVEYYLNFSQFLVDNGIPLSQNDRVNTTNLRIVEQTDSAIVKSTIPVQYDHTGSSLTDQGELAWVISGTFSGTKTYYLYFCLGNTDAFDNPIVQSDYSRSMSYKPFRLHHEGYEYTAAEFQTYKSTLEIYSGQTGASGNPNYAYVQNTTIDGKRGNGAFSTSGNLWLREALDSPINTSKYSYLYFTYSAYVHDIPSASPTYTDYDIIGAELCISTSFATSTSYVYGPQIYGTQNYYDTSFLKSQNTWHYYVFDVQSHFTNDLLRYIYYVHDDDDGTGDDPDNDGDQFYADFPVTYDDLSIWNVSVSKDPNTPASISASTLESVFSNFRITVLDLDGFPVPNAKVKIWNQTRDWNQTGYTDNNGVKSFADVSIGQIYNVSVSYTTSGVANPVTFSIASIENVQLSDFNYNLTINSSIWSMEFSISDHDGDPIDHGFVVLYDTGQPVYNGSLDSDGYTTIRYKNDSTSYDYKVFYDTTELGDLYNYADPFIEIQSGTVTRNSASSGTWVEYGLVDQANLVGSGNYTDNTLAIFSTTSDDFNNALLGTIHVDLYNFSDSITSYQLLGYDRNDVESTLVSESGSFPENVSFDVNGFEISYFKIRIVDSGVAPLQSGVINVSYYLRTTETLICNISTITLNISGDTGTSIEPLANAVILLANETSGESIANITTTTSGLINFTYFRYTPESYGNFTLQVRFVGALADINQTNNPTDALSDWGETQKFTLDTKVQKDVLVNFRDTNYETQINVTNIDPSIAVTLVWGELQLIQVNYTYIQGTNDPVSLPVDKMEYLVYDAELSLIASGEMSWIKDGEYEFNFNSSHVIADTQYTIRFRATKAGYPDPSYQDEVRITVNQVPTQADVFETSSGLSIKSTIIEKKWGEIFNVTVTYQRSDDSSDLSGATVILDWYYDHGLTMVEQSGNGYTNYTVAIDTSKVTSLDKYRVDITANLQNHTIQTIYFDLDVVEIPTTINSDDYLDRIQMYWKENFSVTVNYTDTYNSQTISGANVYYTIVGDSAFHEYTINEIGTTGIYEIEINSTQFGEVGNYTLQVVAMKDNYVTQQMWVSFTINILPTSFISQVSDLTPYWLENFSISVNYTDTHNSLPISDISVSYSITGSSFSESGALINDGNGIYSIEFNTTHFSKAGIYTFKIDAVKPNYESQSISISVEILIIPVNFSTSQSEYNKELNQVFTISVKAEDIRNSGSPISIYDGTVSFTVTGQNFTKSGFLSSVGGGYYEDSFNTSSYFDGKVGTFSFQITFTKDQYQTSTLTVIVNIEIIPTTLTTSNTTITLFWEESFTIAVTYLDARDSSPLVDASVSYTITGSGITTSIQSLPHVGSGVFSKDFISDIDFNRTGTYTFTITAELSEHQTQTLTITVYIETVPTNLSSTENINVYWGEEFTLSVYFEDIRDLLNSVPITTGATVSYTVTGPVGYSGSGTLLHYASYPGTYRDTLNSTDFGFNGTYTFVISAMKNQYETQTVTITVNINIIPTKLTAEHLSISVNWGESFELSVYYEDLYNLIAINDGTISYSASGPNDFADSGFLTSLGTGWYSISFDAIEGGQFVAGTYTYLVTAQKSQYLTQSLSITVNIAVINTTLTTASDTIAVAWNDNFTISVIYFDEDNSENITDGSVTYTVTGHPEYNGSILYSIVLNAYVIEFNSTYFGTNGTYSFTITASKNQYETQQLVINVDIGIRPVNFTTNASKIYIYWEMNCTLSVSYFDIYDSLNPVAISSGTVSYVVSGTGDYSDSGAFSNAGNGNYELFLSSFDFGQAGSYTFEITASKPQYATRTLVITVTIMTIPTELSSSYENDTITLYWGESENLTVSFDNLINSSAPVGIGDATVSYYAASLGMPNGDLLPQNDGMYTFDLQSIDFGQAGTYTFRITATKNQYETQQLVLTIHILVIPTSFTTEQTNYTVTWRDQFIITVQFTDLYRSTGITDGTVSFYVGQQAGLTGILSHEAGGIYSIAINSTDFAGVGSYTLYVTAEKYQYSTQIITFYLVIDPIQTRINNTIFLRNDISINVSTTHYFYITYGEIDGTAITGANVAYFEWEDSSGTHSGLLTDMENGYYRMDFDTISKPVGTYLIAVYLGKNNFVTRSATITLIIKERPVVVELGEQIASKVAETPEGNMIVIEFNLTDPVDNAPLTGATVTMHYRGKNIPIPETDTPGLYKYVIDTNSEEYNALVAAITDTATITVEKANYTIAPFDITISVTPPEFTVGGVGVPKIFVYIGGSVALIAIAIAGTTRYIRYARIPLIIKQIDKTKKMISGNKVISDENLTKTYEEEISDRFKDYWELLDLDITSILGVGKSKTPESMDELGSSAEGGL